MENALFHKPQTVKFAIWHELLTTQNLFRWTSQHISFLWLNSTCIIMFFKVLLLLTVNEPLKQFHSWALLSLFCEQLQANCTASYFTFVPSRGYGSQSEVFLEVKTENVCKLLVDRSWNLILWRAGLALLFLLVGKHNLINELYLIFHVDPQGMYTFTGCWND